MQDSKFSTKRVLIVGTGSMFDEGFTQLVTCKTDLQVSGTKFTNDPALLDAIQQNRPDVLLLIEAGLLNSTRILDLLSAIPSLAGMRVIVVWLSNNVIDVYERPLPTGAPTLSKRQRIIIQTRDDLFTAVSGNRRSA